MHIKQKINNKELKKKTNEHKKSIKKSLRDSEGSPVGTAGTWSSYQLFV